jgi:hypothetical protein
VLGAWDASGGARRDAVAAGAHPLHLVQKDDVGRSAGREQDALGQVGLLPKARSIARLASQAAAVELCKPAVDPSAGRSCAAQAVAEQCAAAQVPRVSVSRLGSRVLPQLFAAPAVR